MKTSANHKRINDILLGPLERPALKWLAAHAPAWMTPDICTSIGVLGSVVILVGYILSRFHPGFFWLATFGFILNWYGDSLDAAIAWKDGDLAKLAGRPIRLRFVLKDADVYALRFG